MKLLESIPNLSEGRDGPRLGSLLQRVAARPGTQLLDASADVDHNRAVLTFAGGPEDLVETLAAMIEVALAELDLRRHSGVHPRFGVVDVVPFVPLRQASSGDAVALAERLAKRVGMDLELPAVLYGLAARSSAHRELPAARGALRRALTEGDLSSVVDEGPSQPHPTGGVVMIGARLPLVAFNVLLETADVEVARRIAGRVRAADGGLPSVRALGVFLASRGVAQVTMNLTDPGAITPARALSAVEREAAIFDVAVKSVEMVGLVPESAIRDWSAGSVRVEGGLERRLLEPKLRRLGMIE